MLTTCVVRWEDLNKCDAVRKAESIAGASLARFIHEILLPHRICPYFLRCASFPSSTYCLEYAFAGTASRALQLRASPLSRDGFHE